MLVKTKNSLYEIRVDDSKIRKLDNSKSYHCVGRDWVEYDYMPYPPAVGGNLCVMFVDEEDDDRASQFTTSQIIEIVDIKNFIWIDSD